MLVAHDPLEDILESDFNAAHRVYPKEDPHDNKTIMTLTWKELELLARKYDYTSPMKSKEKEYRQALKAEKKMLSLEGFDTKYLEMDARLAKGASYNKVSTFAMLKSQL